MPKDLPNSALCRRIFLPPSLRYPTACASWPGWTGNPQEERPTPLMQEAGIAAPFGTSTLPEFRRRGVQTLLINRRLWEAARQRREYVVVSTMPDSGFSATWSGAAFAWLTPNW